MSSSPRPGLRLGLCCQFAREPIRFRTTTATATLRLPRTERQARLAELGRHNYINASDFPGEWMAWPLTVEVEAKAEEIAVLRLQRDLNQAPRLPRGKKSLTKSTAPHACP